METYILSLFNLFQFNSADHSAKIKVSDDRRDYLEEYYQTLGSPIEVVPDPMDSLSLNRIFGIQY